MLNWPGLRDKRKPVIWLLILAPTILVLSVGTYHYMAFSSCLSCHQQEPFLSATVASPHSDVECASCHIPEGFFGRAEFSFRHFANATFPAQGGERDLGYVGSMACLSCHEDVMDLPLVNNGIRIQHTFCSIDSECTDCHSAVAHGAELSWVRTYTMEACLRCHVSDEVMDCSMCHEGRTPEDRITSGTFAVTHGEHWEQTHGMGDSTTCIACHTAASCDSCHGAGTPHSSNFVRVHAEYALSPDEQCADCHQQRFCEDCHLYEMPHTSEFIRAHAQPGNEDEQSCLRCHVQSDCSRCHEAHVHPGGAIGTLPEVDGGS